MSAPEPVDAVLESIDGALTDWTTSKDAMRWTPPPAEGEQPPVMYAFHDEDGVLVVTSDAAIAATAPGPVSIGFDGSRPPRHRHHGCSITPITTGALGVQYYVVEPR